MQWSNGKETWSHVRSDSIKMSFLPFHHQSPYGTRRPVKSTFGVPATVCLSARAPHRGSPVPGPTASASSTLRHRLLLHRCQRCQECVVWHAGIAMIHFWWVSEIFLSAGILTWRLFQFNTLTNALARCPHCRKVSSVGVDFARNRSSVYLAFGIIFLALGIIVAWTTYSYAVVRLRSSLSMFITQKWFQF